MSEPQSSPTETPAQQPTNEGAATTNTEAEPAAQAAEPTPSGAEPEGATASGGGEEAAGGAESKSGAESGAAAAAKEPALQKELEMFRATGQTAFVAGYTGECGKALVEELARTKIFSKVFLLGRREVALEGDIYKGFSMEQKIVDYDNLEACEDVFQGPTVGYCCLGTTRGKAGKDGFKKVDHDYVMKVGELAKKNGCKQYHLISSMGASSKSSMLYPKVKGQVEDETTDLGFEKLNIYRPGLLMCDRNEFRFGEKLARIFMKPVDYLSPGSMTNTTLSIAQAIIARTVKPATDQKVVLEGKAIHRASTEITG